MKARLLNVFFFFRGCDAKTVGYCERDGQKAVASSRQIVTSTRLKKVYEKAGITPWKDKVDIEESSKGESGTFRVTSFWTSGGSTPPPIKGTERLKVPDSFIFICQLIGKCETILNLLLQILLPLNFLINFRSCQVEPPTYIFKPEDSNETIEVS